MKNNEIFNQRLLQFAEHLNSIKNHPGQLHEEVELIELEDEKIRIHFKVIYDHLIIDELPLVFEEFYLDEKTGNPILENMDPQEGPIPSVIDFFGLSPEEFCQIFDVEGFQMVEKHGGKILTEQSNPSDFAFNIIEMVKRRSKI